jgi:hypothetical protein
MMSRFSSFVLALLLLVASGQVMAAATYFSNQDVAVADLFNATAKVSAKWNTDKCTGGTAAVADTAIVADDTFTICDGDTLALAGDLTLPSTGASAITVASGGTLTVADTKTLALAANGGIVNNGTITLNATGAIALSGTGTYTGTGVLNSTCTSVTNGGAWTAAATWGTATAACGVTVGAGSPPLPSSSSDIIIASTTAVTTASPVTAKTLTFKSGTAGKLTLGAALTVTGDVVFTGATGAVLTATGQTVTLGKDLTTIESAGIVGGNFMLTDAAHTLTQTTSEPITFGTLTLITPSDSRTITVSNAEVKATTITGFDSCGGSITPTSIPAAAYTCVIGTISAPIFSTKEKAKLFTEEVQN